MNKGGATLPQNQIRMRPRFLQETGGVCIYCGHQITSEEGTLDHIIPKIKGGVTEDFNLIACCYECNQRKRDKYPRRFIESMTLRQRRGYENRVETLYQQNRITEEKRDLLIDKMPTASSESITINFGKTQYKIFILKRKQK